MYRSFARRGFQSLGLKIRGPAQRPDLETLRVSNLPLRMTTKQIQVVLSAAKDLYALFVNSAEQKYPDRGFEPTGFVK